MKNNGLVVKIKFTFEESESVLQFPKATIQEVKDVWEEYNVAYETDVFNASFEEYLNMKGIEYRNYTVSYDLELEG